MIEYAISHGEGTLLMYGIAAFIEMDAEAVTLNDGAQMFIGMAPDEKITIIARPCTSDCETGK
jgi:hypothetical protein